MPVITASRLHDLCQRILVAMETPPDIAEIVAGALVKADLKGVHSHGCRLLNAYLRLKENGIIKPAARAEIIRQDGAVSLMEGNWGFGQASALQAARLVVESARQAGIGAASLVHVQHIGRVGEYAEYIAEQHMLGIVACNANRATTPFGGMQRMFGTNPIAMAVPRGNGRVLTFDFATSTKSINKLMLARQRGQPLPEGIILDKHGYATTDPNDFFDGGVLLPAGGYKGYAFNLFIDIIGGIMVGAGCGAMLDKNQHPGNGTLFLALDIARWRPLDEFTSNVEQLLALIKEVPVAPDADEVLWPGELEIRAEEEYRRHGIALDDQTWDELHQVVARLKLPASVLST